MTTSEQINEIATAGALAQAELKPAIKDSMNPAFRSKYADYAAIMEAAKIYAKHGIAVWQDVQLTDAGVSVTTRLTHKSGQWIECGPFTVPLGKHDAHGVGSAATYAKRYALSAALGIASDEDDDGNAAAAQSPKAPKAFEGLPEALRDKIEQALTLMQFTKAQRLNRLNAVFGPTGVDADVAATALLETLRDEFAERSGRMRVKDTNKREVQP